MTQLAECVDCLVLLTKLDPAEAVKRMDSCTAPYYAHNRDNKQARGEVRKAFGDKMAAAGPDSKTTLAMLAELDRWM